jgi:AAA+ superfamily predicted ATPase
MGEKLLAQRLIRLLRDTNGRSSRTALALLDWARDQRDWLWPDIDWPAAADCDDPAQAAVPDPLSWDRLIELADAIDTQGPEPALFASADAVSDLVGFEPFEREVLRVASALDRLPRLALLRGRLFGSGESLLGLVGRLAGAGQGDAARLVRRSGPVQIGLLWVGDGDCHGGGMDLGLDWRFGRVIDAGLSSPAELIDALAGLRQRTTLAPEDFAEHRDAFQLLVRLLTGALRGRAAGVNVLLYGPPGTGKTELARTLAAAAGAALYAVGEVSDAGNEPSRSDRLTALRRGQRLLARRGDSLLLFDEMEDMFAAGISIVHGQPRESSKIFVNRLLEGNQVPTIWTSNAINLVDPAHLRRMSFILKMGYPSPRARSRIVSRIAEAEGVDGSGLEHMLPAEEGATGVARNALRAAALADGGADEAAAVGRSLILGLRGGRSLAPKPDASGLDLSLYESDRPIGPLLDALAAKGAPADVSLLLTGPPGTGKTALAAMVAERLDRPLNVRRTSDLLSSWVGETEARIADAFAEARDGGAVLLFDEADSLLFDRADAQRSWEVSQVNELLTWMDSHPLPFIAATNFARRLDPAALRRFVFKIALGPLSPPLAERAWRRFFGGEAPPGLARLSGLTPGDFAVVQRQLRYRDAASAGEILALLEAEARAKPEAAGPIGF